MERFDEGTELHIARILEDANASERRVAVFDWDNTLIRGDIGDLVGLALLKARGAEWLGDESIERLKHSARLTHGATEALRDRTPELLASIAWRSRLTNGEPAFEEDISAWHRSSYAFLGAWLTGLGWDEAQAIARDAFEVARARPFGAVESIGNISVECFARWNVPMVRLCLALQSSGFEVWVVSASPEPCVVALAAQLGIPAARVIGLRLARDERDRFLPTIDGPPAFCSKSPPLMTFDEGKLAYVRSEIFGVPADEAPERANGVPMIVCGDSDTDFAMLREAAKLGVVVNRGAPRVLGLCSDDPDRFRMVAPFVGDDSACAEHLRERAQSTDAQAS